MLVTIFINNKTVVFIFVNILLHITYELLSIAYIQFHTL